MSADETKILLEGFLQKRRDTLKVFWMTYWFRLQNTTLFFYTKKNCSASHLRGYYYIYTVQSVTLVHGEDSKRFMFEIILKNGKRKTMAAETAALRKQWVTQLWEAMHLSVSGLSERRHTECGPPLDLSSEECDQSDGQESSTEVRSSSSTLRESPASPASASAPPPSVHILHGSMKNISSSEVSPLQTNGDTFSTPRRSCGLSGAASITEGDYDVLPLRNRTCATDKNKPLKEGWYDTPVFRRISQPQGTCAIDRSKPPKEGVYDTPVFRQMSQPQGMCVIDGSKPLKEGVYDTPVFRGTSQPQDSAENIYKIPRAHVRTASAHTPGDHHEDGGWTI